MRLLSAVLFVALTGSAGFAEETAPPPAPTDDVKPAEAKPRPTRSKVPLRVVKLLPETRQVLLFDKNKGTHVVAEVGQDVDGYIVDHIGDDDVTLVAQNGTEVILTAPEPTWRRRGADRKATSTGVPAKPSVAKTEPTPEDPYADPTEAAPATPGTDGVGVASATAPADVAPGVAAFMAAVAGEDIGPDGTPTAAPAPVPTPAPAAAPTTSPAAAPTTSPAAAPTTAATAKPADKSAGAGSSLAAAMTGSPAPAVATPAVAAGPTTATIKRADIDAALADFATTASTFRATFTKDGLRFDEVSKGSLLARTGLERGDVVTAVDGQPLRSLDDAANLYARLPTARGTTLQVLRGGKPVTLRVSIQ